MENEFEAVNEELLSVEEKNLPDAETLCDMISRKAHSEFRAAVENVPPPDLARVMETVPKEKRAAFYRLLPKDLAAEVFVELDPELEEELVSVFGDNELRQVLSEIYIDDAVDMIEEMPAGVVKRILNNCSPKGHTSLTFPPVENKNISLDYYSLLLIFKFCSSDR